MFAEPVREIELLHAKQHSWQDLSLKGKHVLEGPAGDLFDIRAEFGDLSKAREVGLTVRGAAITYDVEKDELRCKDKTAKLQPVDGTVTLQVLVDRLSIEIFANEGRVYMPMAHTFEADDAGLDVFAEGGECSVNRLKVFELKSIWE
jgi:sucrose-6-phosphate hydrolase SacC (GH32 family)